MKTLGLVSSIVLPIIVITLFVSQIFCSNDLAGNGSIVSALDRDIQQYSDANIDLKQKIASESSITSVSVRAKVLGFEKVTNIVPLTPEYITVALNTSR